MGSTKKHHKEEREKHKKGKKDKEERDSTRKRKHEGSPPPPHHEDPSSSSREMKEKDRKRKHKRRDRGESSEDSDVPLSKHSKREERSRSRSATPPKGDGSTLSIEETNKLRAKLGLKPLQIDSGPSSSRPPPQRKGKNDEAEEGEAEEDFDEETLQRIRSEREQEADTFWKEDQDFVHAPAENLTKKLQAEKLRLKLQTMRDKRKLEQKLLDTKGIAEEDEDDDAAAWVLKQKSIAEQKALAARKAKELDELDNEFGVGEVVETEFVKRKNKAYTARDIKGMKVLHDQSRINEGQEVIMTLQDKGVLDESDDTLVNVNMIDDERYEKNVKNKQIRPELHGYDAFEDVEHDSEGNLITKNMLAKYDEELGGPQKQSFVIGQDLSEEARRAQIREKMKKKDKILESLESSSLRIMSDFYTPDEMVTFKKPKKKVKKIRKALRADDLLPINTGSSAGEGVINQKDLGSRKKKSNETSLKDEPMDMEIDIDLDDLPGAPPEVDISDVKLEDEADIDFQRALHKARKLKQKETVVKSKRKHNVADLLLQERNEQALAGPSGNGSSIVLHATAEFCRTLGDIPTVDGGDLYDDEEMDFEREERHKSIQEERGAWNEVEMDDNPVDVVRDPEHEDVPILEEEPDVGSGLGAALKLAERKGYLEQEKVKRVGSQAMKDLQAQHYTIEDKNYEEERIGKRDMYAGPVTEFKDKEGYKPEFKLDYHDEDGKAISAKEAFRLLSHKFHGKGSGKNKIDKKRKKTEQEKLLQHMNSTDTPLKTLELLRQKQKESHSAYLILSGSKAHSMLSKSKR